MNCVVMSHMNCVAHFAFGLMPGGGNRGREGGKGKGGRGGCVCVSRVYFEGTGHDHVHT